MDRKEYMKKYHRQYWKDNCETLKAKYRKTKKNIDGVFSIRHGEFYPFK